MNAEQLKLVESLELHTREEIERMKILGISGVNSRQRILDTFKA